MGKGLREQRFFGVASEHAGFEEPQRDEVSVQGYVARAANVLQPRAELVRHPIEIPYAIPGLLHVLDL